MTDAAGYSALDADSAGVSARLDVPGDWRRAGKGGPYRLFWRDADGYGQVLPRPAAAEVPEFYAVDGYYTHGGAEGSAEDGADGGIAARQGPGWRVLRHLAWRADKGVEATVEWWAALLGPAPLQVIEVGCGDGIILERLRSLGHAVTGVEPDPSAAAVARGRGLTIHQAKAEDLPTTLRDGQSDLVILSHVLEHCLDPAAALANCRRALKPGGRIMVEVPNNAATGLAMHGATWLWLDVPRHLNFFTDTSLAAILRTAGFQIRRTEHLGYCRQVSADWLAGQDRVAQVLGLRARSGIFHQVQWLVRTWAAPPQHKYDTLRIVALCGDGAG